MQTFRYDFEENFLHELEHFAIVHREDDRKTFKNEWNKWTEQHNSQIKYEIERLESSGYDGDILDKMFKSARYYFRKKIVNPEEKRRKKYVGVANEFLLKIDEVISELFSSGENYSPASAYDYFCKNNRDIIAQQVKQLVELGTEEDICLKLKKTFKNRFHSYKSDCM